MSSYNLLSEPIRKYVAEQNWSELRPIQNAAIQRILTTTDNYILSAKTASGKTEAAFLPILTDVDFSESGVQVLYISPLIALINDQFKRIEELCEHLDIVITKWHGEASQSAKKKLIKNPNGIVLITPESLEAMFCNRSHEIPHLFSNLKYVVIDEIHYFDGSNRGVQLNSLLYRIQKRANSNFRLIGLSATIGDLESIKKFGGRPSDTKVLKDSSSKPTRISFKYFENKGGNNYNLDLIKDLFKEVYNNKVLIFPNSRGKVEEITHYLLKISKQGNLHTNFFAHHSSVDKSLREYIENFAKTNTYSPFSICCTSTLELGIDIGSVDKVVQIDSTFNIASLVQRIGRSGRKDGQESKVVLYNTNSWFLLQSLAICELYQQGVIDSKTNAVCPFDILVHQILSVIKSRNGITQNELINYFEQNYSFEHVTAIQIEQTIQSLLEKQIVEQTGQELLISLDGEYIVNSKDFYSVFESEQMYKVIHQNIVIGELPLNPMLSEESKFLLASRVWKVILIENDSKKIVVQPANSGDKPTFYGGPVDISHIIKEKMIEILISKQEFDYLDQPSTDALKLLRDEFAVYKLINYKIDRPLKHDVNKTELYTFASSKINRTICLFLDFNGIKNDYNDLENSIILKLTTAQDLYKLFSKFNIDSKEIKSYLKYVIEENPNIIDFSKWGKYLPINQQVSLLVDAYYSIEETLQFLNNIELKENI
ncbi:ATP-dependent Lhr-like helicase [Myroides gitamensis]|uniref:DEAD/DEAH box helicase n=1 Tax=Myroides odoratus TaxID=256 RepID=UPI002169E504|nr:DEAD/DEAH box helicase [Myroides odoratus]MCS4240310.1 ATP-dependent Lhr-like helicase [Myroides odoratus]MDH6600321.1 ATP-dependent Lhr-like helicase [Myroides gitamensis]